VLAIVRKDIVNVAKTPSMLLLLALPVVMFLLFRFVFAGTLDPETLPVVIYDPSTSRLGAQIQKLPGVEGQLVDSEEALTAAMSEAVAGISIPSDFDTAVASERQLEIVVTVNPQLGLQAELAEFRRLLAQQVWAAAGQQPPAHLVWKQTGGSASDNDRNAFANHLFTLMVMTGLGMSSVFVSFMLTEEKNGRKLQVLLMSPASRGDVMVGKGIVGFLFTLLAVGAMILISGQGNALWPGTLVSVTLGAFFMVGVGLLLGTVFSTEQQCKSWGSLIALVLLMPAWVPNWQPPQPWLALVHLLPTTYLVEAITLSLEGMSTTADFGVDLALVAMGTLLVFLLIGWRLRRPIPIE
jgi:ABC-2 type transport system permease protein